MEKFQCRMCGKQQNNLNLVEIDDELKNMIEFHCRISLNLIDPKYPNKVCYVCNSSIIKFSQFTDTAKEVQIKFMAQFQQVKVEIEELPLIVDYGDEKNPTLFVDAPKVELSNANNEDNDQNDEEDVAEKTFKGNVEEGSGDSNDGSSDSDSDYVGNKYYKRRKKPIKHRRIRVRRTRSSNTKPYDEEFTVLNEVPVEDRYKNGTIKKKSLSLFDGKKWSDKNISCIGCNQVCEGGPIELRKHHFKFHSLESHFKCFECPDTVDSILTYFYQYLNHAPEHQESLKFCCVSFKSYLINLIT